MRWDREADVVAIGAGATGLPAAIVAREAGCSVILVEAEKNIGGHAIISGGNVPLWRRNQRAEEIRHRGCCSAT
jgi:succinate dehydrogenase/fumarate reductase flavoprotein subunit